MSINHYFKHLREIPLGTEGELTKVVEEFAELVDTVEQKKSFFTIIESADVVTSLGHFTWKEYKVPLLFVVLFAYLRKPYKWIRNPILRWWHGTKKVDALPKIKNCKLIINGSVHHSYYCKK